MKHNLDDHSDDDYSGVRLVIAAYMKGPFKDVLVNLESGDYESDPDFPGFVRPKE